MVDLLRITVFEGEAKTELYTASKFASGYKNAPRIDFLIKHQPTGTDLWGHGHPLSL